MSLKIKIIKLFQKQVLRVFLLALSVFTSSLASAHDFYVDGIYYNINGSEATVTFGGSDYFDYDYYDEYSGDVIIPSTVTYNSITYPVTAIGEYAFALCFHLTNVTIPNSVTTIGKTAFGATGISNIIIPSSIVCIDDNAFAACQYLTSLKIPSSVSFIGANICHTCENLTNISVENGNSKYDSRNDCNAIVETATNSLISGCKNTLIPNSITSIGKSAFLRCYGLTNIDIPNSVTNIGNSAFAGCNNLTNVTIPNSVTNIGEFAFSGCTNLTNVTIPNSVTGIGIEAFKGCTALETLNFNAVSCSDFSSSSPFGGLNITTINIGDEVQIIPAFFASGLTKLKTVSIGNALTTIGKSAFYNCPSLTSISLPSSLKTINNKAFYNCNELQSVYCSAEIPPAMGSIDCYTSYHTSTLYVPYQSLMTYKTTYYWNEFFKTLGVDDDGHILAEGISLNITSKELYENETFMLIATITPDVTTNKKVVWSSSDVSVATVSANGLVTTISPGSAVITATTTDGSNLSASCDVTIKQRATSISLSKTDVTIYTGNTLQLTATVLPSTTSNPSVTWSSNNTSVATVSSTGLVTAKSTGNAVITATTADGSNLSATCNVTVKRLATSIALNKTSATLYLDQTVQLTATVSPSNATDKSVVWTSSNNSIATVSTTGLVTAIAPGNATITATTADGSNLSADCEITVKAYVTSLTLDQSEATILEGDTITLTPTILPGYATNQSLTWSSSNTSVVSVNNGVVVGRSGGEATVTARTADGSNLSATCKVTVVPNFDISAPNLSHVRGSSNNRFDLTIDLANRYDITGMQFDMQLPDGVTIAKDGYGEYDIVLDNNRKSRNHSVTASLIGYNSYRILVSSATANVLKGHSGTVLHIMIEIPISHVSGNKQIRYTNIILSEPDETRHTLPTKTSLISYYYKEGDANADISVDVADYVITSNYILQNSPENFWYDAANVDHNSTVDVNDLTGITNIALGRREGGILQMPAIQQTAEEDIELDAKPLEIQKGQTKTLELCLNDNFAFAGFQMDIQLPEGLRLVDASLADEDSGLSIATAELPDGSIRLLASSFSLKDLAVNNSSFLRITLSAEDEIGADERIILNGIKFSKRNMSLHTVDHYEIPIGNGVSGLEQVYSRTRIYPEGKSIIIDSPESGTASIVTIAGISLSHDVQQGHNVIPMDDAGLYIVTLNGTTAKLYLK